MSGWDIGQAVFTLGILIASVHLLGYLFERLGQPRLVGEILTGILLGPFVLGALFPRFSHKLFGDFSAPDNKITVILDFIYWLGLMFLMFISGSHTRRLMAKENHREIAWLVGVSMPMRFFLVLGLGMSALIPLEPLMGPTPHPTSTLLILAISVAVTSIPVLSRIFYDLHILQTRFASLILGAAVLDDIILWAVLAIATGMASANAMSAGAIIADTTQHIAITLLYMSLGLLLAPRWIRRLHQARWNLLRKSSLVGYIISILLAYVALAAALEVNLVFAAFLAGFGVAGGITDRERVDFTEALDAVAKFAFAVFIPIYFALVGYKLVLGRDFSPGVVVAFLAGSSFLSLLTVSVAARLAGFRRLDVVNLAVTLNARGGPGIVLASVAFEAGLISAAFYTALVITAVITSQIAGGWLKWVLHRGWPLLSHPQAGTVASAPMDPALNPKRVALSLLLALLFTGLGSMTPHLARANEPTINLAQSIGTTITVHGIAVDTKAGAAVRLANQEVIYIDDMVAWSQALRNQRVRVTGLLKRRKFIPDNLVLPDGSHTQGAEGLQYVFYRVTWETTHTPAAPSPAPTSIFPPKPMPSSEERRMHKRLHNPGLQKIIELDRALNPG